MTGPAGQFWRLQTALRFIFATWQTRKKKRLLQQQSLSWRRRVQIEQLAWSMAEPQIGHRKSYLKSTLSKTDTFGTGTSCPSYRESNRGRKERQGPTLGVVYRGVGLIEVSVKRESTVVLSARFPVVNWRSRSVAKSAINHPSNCKSWETLFVLLQDLNVRQETDHR